MSSAGLRTIFQLDDDDINSSAQRGWIDRIPRLGHRAADASHVLHCNGVKVGQVDVNVMALA